MNNIEINLEKAFKSLDLGEEETKIYLFLLKNGQSSVQDIATKTSIPRSTCYNILDRLQWQGFVSYAKENNTVIYKAEDYEQIKQQLSEKINAGQKAISGIDEISEKLAMLQGRQGATGTDIRYYYGHIAMKKILFEMLEESQGEEVLDTCFGELITNETWSDIPEYIRDYVEGMKKFNTVERAIMEDNYENREYVKNYGTKTSKYIFYNSKNIIDKNFIDIVAIDKYIFKNKVLYMNFEQDFCVLINDKFIANNERLLFNILWEKLSKENPSSDK